MANDKYTKRKDAVCIFSYNSRGFSEEKQDICKLLFAKTEKYYPIVCNQENFILKGNNFKVGQCLSEAHVIFKAAVKDSLQGRPKNGMFIAIPREIKEMVLDVSPPHWRVQAVVLSTTNNKILIINTYFPTDPRIEDFDNTELLSTLAAIESVMKENDHDNILWGGDINADFVRNNAFTSAINRYVKEKCLAKSWDQFSIDFTHSFERDDHTFTSTLDHFFWSKGLSQHVSEADVLHLPNNVSDHSPIYCIIKMEEMSSKKTMQVTENKVIPNWKRADERQRMKFKTMLGDKLEDIKVPECLKECNDVHCKDTFHILNIGLY